RSSPVSSGRISPGAHLPARPIWIPTRSPPCGRSSNSRRPTRLPPRRSSTDHLDSSGTLLVVASLDDADALWFAQRAGTSGVACRVLTTEALSFARRRSHRVTDQGCTTTIEVVAGDIIRDSEIGGVLNRALDPPDRA